MGSQSLIELAGFPKPDYATECGNAMLYCGSCLDVLQRLPDCSVDAVLTDPPYSSGGMFRGDRTRGPSMKYINSDTKQTFRDEFAGDNRDQRSFLAWATLWFEQLLRVSRPGATGCIFTDWRQLPTMTDAVQAGGWVWRGVVTWWKPGVRMQRGRFSHSSEFVLFISNGVPKPGEKSPQNVLSHPTVPVDDKRHIAEKPVGLLKDLLGVTMPGDVVLDPFAGSGSTADACLQLGRRFVGVEIDPAYWERARGRIEHSAASFGLFSGYEADQGRLFGAGDDLGDAPSPKIETGADGETAGT